VVGWRVYLPIKASEERSYPMQPGMETSLNTLNSFLRGELAAVESYREAIDKVDKPPIKTQLGSCLRSHEQRVSVLKQQIQSLGGEPVQSSGTWGTVGKVIAGAAGMVSDKAAVAALEEGEDRVRDDYSRDLIELDPRSRQIMEEQVIPEQLGTHSTMSSLKKTL
jgi:uncharacterized protein (TIGR02284 family)